MHGMQVYQQYRKLQAQTSDRGELVVMLYQGAIKFLGRVSGALQAGDLEEAHNNLVRCQDILVELMGSLKLDGGEVAQNLFRIYEYLHYRTVQANLNKDPQMVEEVARLLRELLPVWQEAARKARAEMPDNRTAAVGGFGAAAG